MDDLAIIKLLLLLKITYSTSYTQLYYTFNYLYLCDQKPFLSFSVHHPYYPHHPRVARHTYLVYLTTVPNTSSRLPLGKYKFDAWFSPSEVLHDSSVCLRNPFSYIHTYEPSTASFGWTFLRDAFGWEKSPTNFEFLFVEVENRHRGMLREISLFIGAGTLWMLCKNHLVFNNKLLSSPVVV